ncbi:MAG: hypothetical protein CMO74_09505 [Verrucomicrobiales bacterium]|nr:hypothetical protein [Verrucomicrobiales bacterium]MBL68664.1 hypothetical protein [Verrucomicrobiales bacterium]|tara:strand:+ start:18016 stop:18759 length:744 start_codon:yes stop_codon:yes gene_type:complete
MFNLQNAQFDYEPYPVCFIPGVLEPALYQELAETYPGRDLFQFSRNIGVKYSLSEINNREKYNRFLDQNAGWRRFYEGVKCRAFVEQICSFLKEHHIDLRLEEFKYTRSPRVRRRGPIRRAMNTQVIRSRFEFSAMPAEGGGIRPHTDAPTKLVTLVLSFVQEGEWEEAAWGGGTSVVVPKDRSRIYNHHNRFMKFDETEVLKTYPFTPNQCLLFIKTYNSWHSVQPMTGPGTALRKTLTINIENII